ncbi:MAG: helix-turn-helix transcriptional regulator [Bdellovibrionaceae bacterium]|nr:helix-turn-helix transcriptional regulator [Bdellovibrionales bacterium]MCB9254475.1 helix-turn-helix transcriptional regulator [Pseudobdellovibrionaceae bacterium]
MEKENKFYRMVLMQELGRRKERNPHYSLRALARDLELSAASLSRIMSGKTALSISSVRRIVLGLELSPEETLKFITSLEDEGPSTKPVE